MARALPSSTQMCERHRTLRLDINVSIRVKSLRIRNRVFLSVLTRLQCVVVWAKEISYRRECASLPWYLRISMLCDAENLCSSFFNMAQNINAKRNAVKVTLYLSMDPFNPDGRQWLDVSINNPSSCCQAYRTNRYDTALIRTLETYWRQSQARTWIFT